MSRVTVLEGRELATARQFRAAAAALGYEASINLYVLGRDFGDRRDDTKDYWLRGYRDRGISETVGLAAQAAHYANRALAIEDARRARRKAVA